MLKKWGLGTPTEIRDTPDLTFFAPKVLRLIIMIRVKQIF